jgi:hypothetical protein
MRKPRRGDLFALSRRQRELSTYLDGCRPQLADLAGRLGAPVDDVLEDPERLVPALDAMLSRIDFREVGPELRLAFHERLMAFIGHWLVQRHRGAWRVDERPAAPSFAQFVIDFEEDELAYRRVDPYQVAARLLARPRGRSLRALLDEVADFVRPN